MTSIRLDDAGEWVAELDCGHRRHVRHDPPRVEHPWVLDERDRLAMIGSPIQCGDCDRRAWPDGMAAYRRTTEFDTASLPDALRRRHTTRSGTWARIHVLAGRLRYTLHEPFDVEEILTPERDGAVLPEVPHAVEPLDDDTRFFVEFHRRA